MCECIERRGGGFEIRFGSRSAGSDSRNILEKEVMMKTETAAIAGKGDPTDVMVDHMDSTAAMVGQEDLSAGGPVNA